MENWMNKMQEYDKRLGVPEFEGWEEREREHYKQEQKEQLRLSRVSSSTQCPFCGGSKITPFVRQGKSQDCKECDKNGMIKNRRLAELDLI